MHQFRCTIVSAATEKWLRDQGGLRDRPILNPDSMPLKMAESLQGGVLDVATQPHFGSSASVYQNE